MEKFILLGASRGLGWAVYNRIKSDMPTSQFLLVSRKIMKRAGEVDSNTVLLEQDFSKTELADDFLNKLREFNATRLIYLAGGGPYGLFQEKSWASHQWCLNTSFLYPAQLVHRILAENRNWSSLKDIVLIGSSIAESRADANGASYAAAKHALKGLVDSINAEQKPPIRVNLFSPGYMQTDLLPPNSHPRLNDSAENPDVVAARLIEYIVGL